MTYLVVAGEPRNIADGILPWAFSQEFVEVPGFYASPEGVQR